MNKTRNELEQELYELLAELNYNRWTREDIILVLNNFYPTTNKDVDVDPRIYDGLKQLKNGLKYKDSCPGGIQWKSDFVSCIAENAAAIINYFEDAK